MNSRRNPPRPGDPEVDLDLDLRWYLVPLVVLLTLAALILVPQLEQRAAMAKPSPFAELSPEFPIAIEVEAASTETPSKTAVTRATLQPASTALPAQAAAEEKAHAPRF